MTGAAERRSLLHDNRCETALKTEQKMSLGIGVPNRRLQGGGGVQRELKVAVRVGLFLSGHGNQCTAELGSAGHLRTGLGQRSTSRQSIDVRNGPTSSAGREEGHT